VFISKIIDTAGFGILATKMPFYYDDLSDTSTYRFAFLMALWGDLEQATKMGFRMSVYTCFSLATSPSM